MNKKYVVIIVILTILAAVFTQQFLDKNSKVSSEESKITRNESFSNVEEQVNSYVTEFNAKKHSYTKTDADVNQLSTEGGTVTGYFNGTRLMLMESIICGETGQKKYDVYYIHDDLSYLSIIEMGYDKPITEPDSKIVSEAKTEYVIMNNKLKLYDKKSKKIIEVKNSQDLIEMIDAFRDSLRNTVANKRTN